MTEDRILDEAAGWFARQHDDAMDWDGFARWLEVDSRHRAAFDELALIDADLESHAEGITAHLSEDVAATAATERSHGDRWRWWGAGAVAASIAAVIGLQFLPSAMSAQSFTAPAGEVRTVVLPDGVTAALSPGTTLSVRGSALALTGRAFFDVRHQAARPLTIQAGDFQVHDIGTRFTVGAENGSVEIEVASGALSVSSPKLAQPISLAGGRAMIADETLGTVRLAAVDPAWVGSWRNGKLHYENAPLAMVARDISRYSSTKIIVDPAVAGQAFSGVIVIDDARSPAQTLADIMALELRPVHGALRLQPRTRR